MIPDPLLFLLCSLCRAQTLPPLTERQRLLHVLDRLTFGPRPDDLENLRREGIDPFIERQLHPDAIPDTLAEQELRKYSTLSKSSIELFDGYPDKKRKKRLGLFGTETQPPRTIVDELAQAKLTRLLLSERQLQEVMVDFWFNHFNVYALKNQVRFTVTPYERDVLRPRALGKFRDLLGAVAHSPAMLVYLDNHQSTVDPRYAPLGAQEDIAEMESRLSMDKGGRAKLGLNENYARELMELHTLGVDGGYSQKDVTELARVLTGWSVDRPSPKNKVKDIQFRFRRKMHDPGGKVVLGEPFLWSGEQEGEKALDMLARHLATARFIARKLCRRFVADDPPPALVERVAARFHETDGDIRESLRTIFASPEFFDPRFFRAKVKSPLEFVASALRASGAQVRDPLKVVRSLERMGEPLYLCEPPTGYPDKAQPWINSGALLARMNAALSLFNTNPAAPASADARLLLEGVDSHDGPKLLSTLIAAFLGGEVSEKTQASLTERLDDPEISSAVLDDTKKNYRVNRLAALVLGSPDFQRR